MAGLPPFPILVGPAKAYIAPTGSTFPEIDADPASPWVNLGKTDAATQVNFAQNINPIYVDQTTGALKAVRTQEGIEVNTNLVELTLETFAYAINGATPAVVAGPPAKKTLTLFQGVQVAQFSLLLRVDSAYSGGNGQFELPVVIQMEASTVSFTRADKSVLTARWLTLEDPDAISDEEKFGRIAMATT